MFDEATGLMWQQSGSSHTILFRDAKSYIKRNNEDSYAGFFDWRLPTLEEAISLIEPEKNQFRLNINSVFDNVQDEIWTSDEEQGVYWPWGVSFKNGGCFNDDHIFSLYVRAVRFGQSFQK